MKKVALCFIISYEHILNKEHIWREWIEPNRDIIEVNFYYKDITKIRSPWILQHCLSPEECAYSTNYFHVIPAYLSLMNHALRNPDNQWICFLTDSCCPIVSPSRFRSLFFRYKNKSIFSWTRAWWNPYYHKRANLALYPEEMRLANDPWFILQREDAETSLRLIQTKSKLLNPINNGGLANESLFAIVLHVLNRLTNVINLPSHATDWSRMASSTSPHVFTNADVRDIQFIENTLKKVANGKGFTVFIRKIASEFPDEVLRHYIYDFLKETQTTQTKPIFKMVFLYVFLFTILLYIYIYNVQIKKSIYFI